MKLNLGRNDNNTLASGFLPEDYLERKAQRRTNALAITLFAVVIAGVIGAFFVTNRQWNEVRAYQEAINVRYSQAAADIEQLKVLEEQKKELLEKAELTTTLIERVPRSILLAELINRMPEQMTLLDLEVKSKRVTVTRERTTSDRGSKSLARRSSRNKAEEEEEKPEAPRYETNLEITGVAPTHTQVAEYVANLQKCTLLRDVDLKFSDKTTIKDRQMFKFRIETRIGPNADARHLEPEESLDLKSVAELGVTPEPVAGVGADDGEER